MSLPDVNAMPGSTVIIPVNLQNDIVVNANVLIDENLDIDDVNALIIMILGIG